MSIPTIASWNIRGFNRSDKVACCKRLISSFKLDMICLLENRIKLSALQDPFFSLAHTIFPNEASCNNFHLSLSGRIWIKWDISKLHFNPIFITSQMITGMITFANNCSFYISVIYASNSDMERLSLWEDIRNLEIDHSLPWILMGDFNCCRYASEKVGGDPISQNRLWNFNSLVFDIKVMDLQSVGCPFTWFNNRLDNPIHIKLDRVLVNENWLNTFPNSFCSVQPPPVLIISGDTYNSRHRFLFKNYWTRMDNYWDTMLEIFSVSPCGNPIIDFCNKLKKFRGEIKNFDWANSNVIQSHMDKLHKSQADCLDRIAADPLNPILNATLKSLTCKVSEYSSIIASWVIQRAKAKWLSHGEDDLNFLYAKIRARQAKLKAITNLTSIGSTRQEIISSVISHFEGIYNPPSPPDMDMSKFPIGDTIDSSMASMLVQDHLSTFANASGLVVNYEKSSLLTPNTGPNYANVCSALSINNTSNTITYIGIPISDKCLKIADFMPLVEKITRTLSGWKAGLLSFAARLQFIRYTILNSIAYWIRGAIIPKTVLKVIRKLSSKFLFFGDTDSSHKLHMISWGMVCLPKQCGGLGLHSPSALQFGFNCSLINRIYNHKIPLGRWLLMRYSSPWRPPPVNATKFWRAVCNSALTAKPYFNFRVTPSAPISFYWDHWCPVVEFLDHCHAYLNAPVRDFIIENKWVLPSVLDPNIARIIQEIPISDDSLPCLIWDNQPGNFGAYVKIYYVDSPTCLWANHLWFKGGALRYSVYGWMCLAGGLKTAEALSLRNIFIEPLCPLCRTDRESTKHIFFECNFSYNIITQLIPQATTFYLRPNASQFLDWLDDLNVNSDYIRLYKLITCCAIYLIWRERNDRRFGGISNCSTTVLKKIQASVCAKVFKWKNGVDLLDHF
ncbi:hypothetical protein M5K25_022470 [Dendrobium thyrsiflorum]|uniref:Reverse transcriptase zinc-binding domain-containing protein n=1 Tax=Dendrobium thyrsiflorum TaxID=117978 RepID=A0ABD0U694_DENTH